MRLQTGFSGAFYVLCMSALACVSLVGAQTAATEVQDNEHAERNATENMDVEVLFDADSLTHDEIARLGLMFDAPAYYLVRDGAGVKIAENIDDDESRIFLLSLTQGVLRDGSSTQFGSTVSLGDHIGSGVYINLGPAAIPFSTSGDTWSLQPGEMIAVGNVVDDVRNDSPGEPAPQQEGCSVECGGGYYACCDEDTGRCRCIQNGFDEPNDGCEAGGPGATSCSMSLSVEQQ